MTFRRKTQTNGNTSSHVKLGAVNHLSLKQQEPFGIVGDSDDLIAHLFGPIGPNSDAEHDSDNHGVQYSISHFHGGG